MNFAIMRSGFGGYWIGKTKREVKDGSIFSTFNDAIEEAKNLNDSIENLGELEEMEEEGEEAIEKISKGMEQWIV